jgi:hypothetical protein
MDSHLDTVKEDLYLVSSLISEILLTVWTADELAKMPTEIVGMLCIAICQKVCRDELVTIDWLETFYELSQKLNPLDQ